MDYFTEYKAVKEWKQGKKDSCTTTFKIAEQVYGGFQRCSEDCNSRNNFADACHCIRSNFTCPEHYELYSELRRRYTKMVAMSIIAETISDEERSVSEADEEEIRGTKNDDSIKRFI